MPQLHILSGKRQGDVVELAAGAEVDIGNRKSARLSIRDPWVSYNHARIVVESGRFVIEDQDSSNGTWLDAPSGPKRIKRHELAPNDVFALGKTRIKFVGDVPAAATASYGAGPGLTRKLPQDQPWWDKNVQPDAPRSDGALAQELAEERKMRQALERFLELPAGTSLGDATRAGALEREVAELKKKLERGGAGGGEDAERLAAERTEKLRQEMMKRQVELEGRASAAEAKVVDLEQRLVGKSDQTRKEVSRAREKLQAEVDELKRDLEEARARAKELAAGGDGALDAERQRGERLERELDEARGKARAAEERAEKLERELSEARQAPAAGAAPADPALREQLEQALSEAERWKAEHQAVIQEIDEISMEQIEIEDGLKARVRELEAQLAALGGAPAPATDGPAPRGRGSSGTGRVVEAAASLAPRGESAQTAPAQGGSMGSYDSASLGVLPRSELGAPAIDDGDMDGSADTTSGDELT